MHRFWNQMLKPLFLHANVKRIVQIGAENGVFTTKLLDYCKQCRGTLYVVDGNLDVSPFSKVFKDHLCHFSDESKDVLPQIQHYDAVLMDGDHNWYTVYHDLKMVEKKASQLGQFPLVVLHDTAWPYGRRDMYLDPEQIPDSYRHPYAQKGMIAGQSQLAESGGFNAMCYHALEEGGEKNGVLTAIEDFLKETPFSCSHYQFETCNGLSIIYPDTSDHKQWMKYVMKTSGL
ncbi:class I SAM-dependent methyltransferase [Longirhabdus pacifica]|uniref:class I SAM-dependent methyltransferase n=1 Tax=Longirhabdus pacifica TaxID=2305227 RepID=UPI001008BDB1|nr:class I SAM-dependent methyltransferase [Longirhabdus pacifica]